MNEGNSAMAKPNMAEFIAEWEKAHDHGAMSGAMLMKYGPEDYAGAAICVRGATCPSCSP